MENLHQHNSILIIRAALYARVSTEEQKEGQTIDSQIAELERFAKEKVWVIAGVYKDEGWSGGILARPELDRLRDDASKSLFDLVLINDVDRLARDVSHLGIIKRDLERCGVQVYFRKLPAEKSPTYNLMVNILGSFAEFERELIADRTRRGRRHKVEVRQLFLGSLASYGYRYIPKDSSSGSEGYLQIVPEEATVVRQMYDCIYKEGLSAQKVVKRLNQMGIPPRKGGKSWGKSSVMRILRNEIYAGVWYYNKHELCEPFSPVTKGGYKRSLKSSNRLRDRSEWLPVTLPKDLWIIERSLWERVQNQLTANRTFSPRNSKHQYLLKGLIRCGGCGAAYVGDPNHGRFYYRCIARCKKFPTIKEVHLNTAVWSAIKEAVLNPSIIEEQLREISQHQAANVQQTEVEVVQIEKALEEIQKEESRIIAAYRTSILSSTQLARELELLNARKSSLEVRRGQVSVRGNTSDLSSLCRSVSDYCKVAARHIERFGFDERQRFLRLLVKGIVFEGHRIRIKAIIPAGFPKDGKRDTEVNNNKSEGGFKSWIASTMLYLNARNEVHGVHFELVRPVPQRPLPFYQQLNLSRVRRLVYKHPHASLKQFRKMIKDEQGISISIQTTHRILRRVGLPYKRRRELRKGADKSSESLAA